MSSEPSMPHQRGVHPKIWYLLATLVAYPLLMVAVQDPQHALSGIRPYLRPAVFAFPYEEQLLALAFAIVFMAGFALFFVSAQRSRFVLLGTIATALFYPAVIYIATQYYTHTGRASPSDFSPAGRGYLMFLAAACALIALMRTFPAWRADVLGSPPRPVTFREGFHFFATGYSLLLIAYLYPLFLIVFQVFPDVSEVRIARLAELLDISPFSGPAELAALIGAALFSAIFSTLVVNVGRLAFWGSMIPVIFIFYNLLIYSYDRFMPKLCKAPEISLCMSYLEIGFLFALSFALSLLLFQRAVRYFRRTHVYRQF